MIGNIALRQRDLGKGEPSELMRELDEKIHALAEVVEPEVRWDLLADYHAHNCTGGRSSGGTETVLHRARPCCVLSRRAGKSI